MHVVYIYIYIYIHTVIYIYIYIYIYMVSCLNDECTRISNLATGLFVRVALLVALRRL